MEESIIKVEELGISFRFDSGEKKAVEKLSFELRKGEVLGIVGESGCGKSLTSLAIMGLIPTSASRVEGKIWFHGDDLLKKSEQEMHNIRGKRISMIFQDPLASLNPAYTIGNQLIETIRYHHKLNKKESTKRAVELLQLVGLSSPERRIHQYPHELSGGMRQRVTIALALSCNPEVLIADEPTTALDVTIQAGVIELLMKLRDQFGMSIIIISHDLGVISQIADNVMVMYAGRTMEQSSTEQIFKRPMHPYTRGLISSIPSIFKKQTRLEVIKGTVPGLGEFPQGCKFHTRCPYVKELCIEREPILKTIDDDTVRCWMATKEVKFNG